LAFALCAACEKRSGETPAKNAAKKKGAALSMFINRYNCIKKQTLWQEGFKKVYWRHLVFSRSSVAVETSSRYKFGVLKQMR
jgi:hypothetical protein